MASDQDRRDLYEALEHRLGVGPAATMTSMIGVAGLVLAAAKLT